LTGCRKNNLFLHFDFFKLYRRAASIYGALSKIQLPMDILVFTPKKVEEWSGVRQAFVTTAVREGTVLYEKQN